MRRSADDWSGRNPGCPECEIESEKASLLGQIDLIHPRFKARGRGARDLEFRVLDLKSGHVVGVDVASTALAFFKERKPYRLCQAPFSHLFFRSGSIHLLTGFDVLEHGEDDRAMLTEALRLCAPGGWAVFSVPAYPFMWGDHDVAAHH